MKLNGPFGALEIINEGSYSFGFVDNVRTYPFEKNFSRESTPISVHGVLLNGQPLAVFGASGGATGVHSHSAVLVDTNVFLAICDTVVCLEPSPTKVIWTTQVDPATCFGIYYQVERSALFSHGELEITRLTKDGSIVWSASGADIFTEGFELFSDFIKVIDFNGKVYRLNYETGEEIV